MHTHANSGLGVKLEGFWTAKRIMSITVLVWGWVDTTKTFVARDDIVLWNGTTWMSILLSPIHVQLFIPCNLLVSLFFP